jgi:hypothetical protein
MLELKDKTTMRIRSRMSMNCAKIEPAMNISDYLQTVTAVMLSGKKNNKNYA